MTQTKASESRPLRPQAGRLALKSRDLDLDIPLSSTPSKGRRKLAKKRVKHHLLQALNALNEAAQYYRSAKHTHGITIVSAVLQTVVDRSSPRDTLKNLALAAAPLLTGDEPQDVIPQTVHDIAAAKVLLLRDIRHQLAQCRSFPSRAKDGRLNWDKVSRIADSADIDASRARRKDAANLSATIVGSLFYDRRLLALHSAKANSAALPQQVKRLKRVVIELANNEQATPVQIARAALFLLGRKPRELKNFFGPDCIEMAEAPADG